MSVDRSGDDGPTSFLLLVAAAAAVAAATGADNVKGRNARRHAQIAMIATNLKCLNLMDLIEDTSTILLSVVTAMATAG